MTQACPTSPTRRCAAASRWCSPRRPISAASASPIRTGRARAPASWSWRSASTGRASSTIRATSTSSCSSTPHTAGRCRRAPRRRRSTPASRRQLARLLQERTADGYVHRVDYRLRPDPGSTPTAVSLAVGLHLLRDRRPELGARGADQGAARRRRHRARRALPQGSDALHLAQVFRLRVDRRRACHEAADPCGARARRDRGRRPRHQARARRHPRDRVLRADAAARLRRAPAGPARAPHPRHAGRAAPTRAGSPPRRATSSARPTASCARSSTACRWSPTSRRSACPPARRSSRRFARFCGYPTLKAFEQALTRQAAHRAAPLRAAVRGGARAGLRCRQPRLHRHERRSGDARDPAPPRLPAPRARRPRPCAAGISAAGPRSRAPARARS